MSLKHVYDMLVHLEGFSGKALEGQFATACIDPDFKKAVIYALHPYMVYNIQKLAPFNVIASSTKSYDKSDGHTGIYTDLDRLAQQKGATDNDNASLARLSSEDRETWEVVRRIVNKDLRIGVGLKTARKYIPELPIHETCLCEKDLDKFLKYVKNDPKRVAISTKLDGVRCFAVVHENKVDYLSRNGKPFHNFGVFDQELKKAAARIVADIGMSYPIVFDGEAVSKDKDFHKLMTQVRRVKSVDASDLQFHIFDLPFHQGHLEKRYDVLCRAVPERGIVRVLRHSIITAQPKDLERRLLALANAAYDAGEEGLVIKDWESKYEFKRTRSWCKLVATHTEDLYVTGWYPGEGKYEGLLGGLYVDYNGVTVGVGSGFSDDQRVEFMEKQPKMIEVAYREITPDLSLRFPRFKRVRSDKA